MNSLKLLVEEPIYDLEYLVEEKNRQGERTMFIRGPYLMAEKENKNKRIYPLKEIIPEVNRYTNDMIKRNRALGELNHPTSVEINPERACHAITEIKQENNIFVGKSKILNTPLGNLVKNLIMDGIQLGISSRALGKLNPDGGHNDVSNFRLITCDIVHDPSADVCFIDGILESKSWMIKEDGSIIEAVEQFKEVISTLPKYNKSEFLRSQLLNFIETLKKKS